ncbi:membrane protein [Planotetraspora thailandica]|uniref:Membrane protein n=1 Tax=Planotetraspora thailandica TaxID=487172 RepID=A0A8J3UZL0_9ACTN|nr:anthrone oxygenase family protein [Planotetraspora thailandica]GII54763.1 membrane protein [Planotetraspora thailandica]
MTGADLVVIAATVATGLMAGLFFAFTIAVMPALAAGDDHTFVHAMRRINVAILNGWFALAFGGSAVLTAAAALLHIGEPELPWLVGAFAAYGATLAITFAVNVPLNNELDKTDEGSAAALGPARRRFERGWVWWNAVRTLTNLVAFCLAAGALAL